MYIFFSILICCCLAAANCGAIDKRPVRIPTGKRLVCWMDNCQETSLEKLSRVLRSLIALCQERAASRDHFSDCISSIKVAKI
ncbi:hypothetical protein Ciccas_009867 [Cichlidogyrus casuarinus]|uniref:Secreted protein n=1 Tax=Cichlidogyrus casuarinus TaxID=1844966 RepID=A0ABD2PVS5_9PLAT